MPPIQPFWLRNIASGYFRQRFAAAFLAISVRRSGVMALARALPPLRPSSTAAESRRFLDAILNLAGCDIDDQLA
jgi:hypothetical protein